MIELVCLLSRSLAPSTRHSRSKNKKGIKYINGYDDPEIVAGAGTIGIEVLEQIASADYVIVPVGGAGTYYK